MRTSSILIFLLMLSAGLQAQEGVEQPLQAHEPNYVMETARPTDRIRQDYPYDIELKQADGTLVRSDAVFPADGKPVLLLFWLTTCYPCRMELEALKKAVPQWKRDLDFHMIAVSTDFQKNFPAFTQRVETEAWSWPAFNDVHREFSRIMPGGLNGLPQTFVLDGNGQIVYHKRKYSPGDETAFLAALHQASGK